MKQVTNQKSNTVDISRVIDTKYYGVCREGKGFITRKTFNGGGKQNPRELLYKALCIDCVTQGNGWDAFDNLHLESLCNNLINAGFAIYQFENPKELFEWLGQ